MPECCFDFFLQLLIAYSYENQYAQNPDYEGSEFPSLRDGLVDHRSHLVRRRGTERYGPVEISFVNGILNQPEEMHESLNYIHDMGFDCGLSGVYNGTKGIWDGGEYLYNLCLHGETRPVSLLCREIDDYFANCPEDGIMILILHSQGAVIGRNALELVHPDKRERIHVIAVAPGGYIDRHLCGSVVHLVSDGDIVHYIDFLGAARNGKTTTVLPRDANAKGWIDHEFKSPTFELEIRKQIKNVLIKTGK